MGKRRSMKAKAPRGIQGAMSNVGKAATSAQNAMTTAVLPYAGTSGHSGTDTSEERVRERDASGKTLSTQNDTLKYVTDAGVNGITVAELRAISGWHHGIASAALTNMHGANKISRLAAKRNRCHVYVGNDFVDGRPTEVKGTVKGAGTSSITHCPNCGCSL